MRVASSNYDPDNNGRPNKTGLEVDRLDGTTGSLVISSKLRAVLAQSKQPRSGGQPESTVQPSAPISNTSSATSPSGNVQLSASPQNSPPTASSDSTNASTPAPVQALASNVTPSTIATSSTFATVQNNFFFGGGVNAPGARIGFQPQSTSFSSSQLGQQFNMLLLLAALMDRRNNPGDFQPAGPSPNPSETSTIAGGSGTNAPFTNTSLSSPPPTASPAANTAASTASTAASAPVSPMAYNVTTEPNQWTTIRASNEIAVNIYKTGEIYTTNLFTGETTLYKDGVVTNPNGNKFGVDSSAKLTLKVGDVSLTFDTRAGAAGPLSTPVVDSVDITNTTTGATAKVENVSAMTSEPLVVSTGTPRATDGNVLTLADRAFYLPSGIRAT